MTPVIPQMPRILYNTTEILIFVNYFLILMVIFSCDYESQLRKEVYHGKYCPAAERNYALRQNDFRLRRGARRFKENHEKKDSEYRAIQGK